MSADQITATGVFRVGDVLGRAWRIFAGNLLFFLGAPVLIYAAVVGTVFASTSLIGVAGTHQGLAWVSFGVGSIIELGLYTIGQAMVLLGALQRLRGEPLRVGRALRRSLARVIPLLVLAVLWSLALGVCLIAASFIVPLMIFRAGIGMLFAYALVPIAFVPAAMAFVVCVAVVPACAVEGLGPVASMFRSFDLTKGCRWKVFGIMLLAVVLFLAGSLIDRVLDPVSPMLANVVSGAWVAAVMAIWNCTIAMIYHDLRAAREGADTGQIAAIFD